MKDTLLQPADTQSRVVLVVSVYDSSIDSTSRQVVVASPGRLSYKSAALDETCTSSLPSPAIVTLAVLKSRAVVEIVPIGLKGA